MVKDELRHIKISKSFLSMHSHQQRQTKRSEVPLEWGSGRGFDREDVDTSPGNYVIGCSVSGCLIWESPVGCL